MIANKEGESETKNGVFIRRHTIVSFECIYGMGKHKVNTLEYFRVLSMFSKQYNKWFCTKEDKIEWYPKNRKEKYCVLCIGKKDSRVRTI